MVLHLSRACWLIFAAILGNPSGIIAAELAAKSAPDGYTMYVGTTGGLAINVNLYKKLPYHPARDFAPIFPGFKRRPER